MKNLTDSDCCILPFSVSIVVFPPGCTTFHGPHEVTCLNGTWTQVGCPQEGLKSPANMNILDRSIASVKNLRWWTAFFRWDISVIFAETFQSFVSQLY